MSENLAQVFATNPVSSIGAADIFYIVVNGTTDGGISGASMNNLFSPRAGSTSIVTVGTIATGVWNGTVVDLAHGGTGANITASNGGILYSTATTGALLSGIATAGRALLSGANAAPTWSSAAPLLTGGALGTPSSGTLTNCSGLPSAGMTSFINTTVWTPSVGGTATYTVQSGIYTQIGNIVHLQGQLTINAIGTGSVGVITGVPVSSPRQVVVTVGYFQNAATTLSYVSGLLNGTTITLTGITVASGSMLLPPTFFTSTTNIIFSCVYSTT